LIFEPRLAPQAISTKFELHFKWSLPQSGGENPFKLFLVRTAIFYSRPPPHREQLRIAPDQWLLWDCSGFGTTEIGAPSKYPAGSANSTRTHCDSDGQ